ncbi:glycosyltransferase involved in cell wall biosynthesis [Hamadaea flava]|uniref:Glycosyltransferase n=1 Tax=Hamadaea flava TaxID=1742688 RepID=A0ABV8LLG7_9ACTN|nr:hypothetical protein [Hamadaea flava]MCP2329571.1 glycosyltransferase involved in cell wall biosynthesis [Hamadaea flava]
MGDHRLAVLIFTNEGFRQVDGGVARVVHDVLDLRSEAVQIAQARGATVRWHIAERASNSGYDPVRWAYAEQRWLRDGDVRYHRMADPRAHPWEMDHFEHCVAMGAAGGQVMLSVAEDADSVLVISGMSMFAMAARFVIRAADQFQIPATYVHLTHNPVLNAGGDAELPETYADSVMGHLARHDERVTIGWESEWMRDQYQQVYGIPDGKTLFAYNGIRQDSPKFDRIPPDEVEAILRSLGVPLDRDLMISWGRGVREKGFELFLDAAAQEKGVLPVVLNPRPNPALEEYNRSLGSPGLLLSGQDDRVLAAFCQWPRTLAAVFLSERESASITGNEATLMNGGTGLVVVGVPAGVYPELIDDGVDGVMAKERTVAGVAEALRSVVEMPPAERAAMSVAALERTRRTRDYRTNWLRSFTEMVDRHFTVIGRSAEPRA